jgi:hypothetical protein
MAWLTRDTEVLASVQSWRRVPWRELEGAVVLEGPALVHTFGCPVALDVAWCRPASSALEVRRVATVCPRRIARPCGTKAVVIAAPCGAFERWRLQLGDLLEITRP